METVGDPTMKAAGRREPRVLSGFRDFLPEQMLLRQRIVGVIRAVFERHGFEPLDTPALELIEVLTGKAGENEKLMYRFTDGGGREVGLRYDLTVPLARVVAMHQNDLVFPFKRYHIAPVWRAERAQRGRFREFWQCDADIAGSASMLADAEVVAVMAEALAAVGLPRCTIRINHRQLLAALARAAGVDAAGAGTVFRAIDKLDKIGPDGVARELEDSGITAGATGRILAMVTEEGDPAARLASLRSGLDQDAEAMAAIDQLGELFGHLPAFGVADEVVRFDLSLARGLDYYTGPVFEAVVEEPKVGSVAGAGRYDGLIGTFLGRSVPATGISLGLERIIEVVKEFDLLPGATSTTDVFVAVTRDTVADAAQIAARLRDQRLRVDLGLQPARSLGDQAKYAARKGIPVAVLMSPADVGAGTAVVRALHTGAQTTVLLDDLGRAVHEALRADDAAGPALSDA
ncbi:MAG: Histidyl-tRNA synthetase [uncultured Thermomicrobiales bacterium]|uniref:Histidine--tRNA ligase n=1 Tax=uncultured Thermomicrobiales bacterium TaxID=1645740 RepID=A0A6J4UHR6_9BACT|nr:MAG: Histidyl-tRNA synthetase [uncultured Thermomicrobiales bacterium]